MATVGEHAPLAGKHALVTGGSRGIGRAICLELARLGAGVTLFYFEHHDAAAETVRELAELGVEAERIQLDVADTEQVAAAVDDLAGRDRRPDVLVNCAGINRDRTLLKLSAEDWHRVVDVNLGGCFNCSQAVLPGMRESGFGRIISISSIIGQTGNLGQANYAAAKAGIIGFTKSLALETARYDITVNAVCPGFIQTDMLDSVPEEAQQRILAQIPKGRFGDPLDVARVVGFLADPGSAYITGQQVNVNGGMYL